MATRDDFIGQNNPNVQIYAAENGLIPEYVDEAPMITEEDIAGLSNTAFANPYARTFPCHTKVACVQSALWDAATHPGNELVTNNIIKAAAAHGVSEDVEKIYTHFREAFTKAAAAKPEPPREYALTLTDDDGREDRFFDISDPVATMHSAEEADRQYRAGNIADPYFRKIASSVTEAAAAQGIDEKELPRSIRVFGTTRMADPYMAKPAMVAFCKRSHVDPAPYLQKIAQLQAAMEKAAMMDEAQIVANAIADSIVDLNVSNGLTPSIADTPYNLIFTGPTEEEMKKRAANTVYMMDVPVPAQAIIDIPDETIDTRFAPQAAGLIRQAQGRLQQDDMDKAAAAAELLSQLSPGAMKQLLKNLSQQE